MSQPTRRRARLPPWRAPVLLAATTRWPPDDVPADDPVSVEITHFYEGAAVPEPTLERQAVERVAREYQEKGYDVTIAPAVSELPDFLREFTPDIIARSSKECVVVEVKNWVSAADNDRLRAIARKVDRPGWRFVVVSPGGSDRSPGPALQDLDETQVVALLDESAELRQRILIHAAILIGWAGLEAAMRRVARANAIEARRSDPGALLRELVSNGIVDRERYRDLSEVLRVRSAVAHGFVLPDTVDSQAVLDLVNKTARELLEEARKPPEPA